MDEHSAHYYVDACRDALLALTRLEQADVDFDTYEVNDALRSLTHVALLEQYTAYICQSHDLVKNILRVAATQCPKLVAIRALICLDNLAIFPTSHELLLTLGALDIALSNLRSLLHDGCTDEEMDCGLSSAFLICRTVGREETGPGPQAIKGNPLLIDKLEWVLRAVLDAGRGGVVIGATWNPANIMLDVATLATSDRNKPLLVRFVPLVVRALQERGEDNFRLVKYASQALSQLVFEKQCKAELVKLKPDVISKAFAVIGNFKEEPEHEQTHKEIQVLVSTLMEEVGGRRASRVEAPPPGNSGGGGSKWKKLFTATSALSATNKAAASAASAAAAPSSFPLLHVMISYNWGSQPVALQLEAKLASAGHKTWFDLNDMGSNISDSMAEAVENSWLVVCLVTRKYKESGNCRKELEMADNLAKPILYVKCEEQYKPEGWLALVMGKALWVACFQPQDLEPVAWPQIVRRLKIAKGEKDAPPASPAHHASSVAVVVAEEEEESTQVAATASSSVSLDQVLAMLTALQRDNAEMKQALATANAKLDALISKGGEEEESMARF